MSHPSTRRRPSGDAAALILRVCVGIVFVIGGVKLVLPSDAQALAASYVDPSTGWISPYFAELITVRLGIEMSRFLFVQGAIEIVLGLAMILGLMTPGVAIVMGMMYWAFAVANPVVGEIRLSRDVALMGICFAIALAGAGRWSLDGRLRGSQSNIDERKDFVVLVIRLSLAFTLLTSAIFAGGPFNNHLNSTLPRLLVLLLGLLLVFGIYSRWVAGLLAMWMLYLVATNLVAKGLLPGLDSVKREIGFLGATLAIFLLGADRWARPRSHVTNLRAEPRAAAPQ
jgi:uncharacterized membrane protein YphA (DoxX/SURF4 family)